MDRACVIYLRREPRGAHGVLDHPEAQEVKRYATRKSAGRSEWYQAGAMGLQASCIFALTVAEEYACEQTLRCGDELFRVIRVYETPDGGVELTCERGDRE